MQINVSLTSCKHVINYSQQEISEILSETQVDKTKLIYSLELWPYEKDSLDDKSYHQVIIHIMHHYMFGLIKLYITRVLGVYK